MIKNGNTNKISRQVHLDFLLDWNKNRLIESWECITKYSSLNTKKTNTMINQKQIIVLLLSLVLIASCKSSRSAILESNTQTITVKETVHDTVFKIEKDSSSYQALLECQNGKVVIKDVIQAKPGRTLKSPKVRLDNNLLKIDCQAQAQQLLAQYKNTLKTTNTVIKIPVEVNKLTWWQQTQITLFRILAVILLLITAWQILKAKI